MILLPYANREHSMLSDNGHKSFTHRLVDVSGYDYAYAHALASAWVQPYDLLVIEHDNFVHESTIGRLLRQTEPTHVPYPLHQSHTSLPYATHSAWSYPPGGESLFGKATFPAWMAPDSGIVITDELPPPRHLAQSDDERATMVGLGCTFIPASHLSRKYPLPLPFPYWKWCDRWVCLHVAQFDPDPQPWQLLWEPIKHLEPVA